MTRLTIQLTITLDTPLSVGAGGSAGTLADKSIVRDGWGRPIIPGSQVKGKLRWAIEQLLRGMDDIVPSPFEEPPDIPKLIKDAKPIKRENLVHMLFGSVTWRSPLRFVDLPTTIVSPQQAHAMHQNLSQIRPSVSINRRRGTAEDARLLFQEVTLEGMQFSHSHAITGELPNEIDAQQAAALLWAGLKLTDRWGGAKSRGLGWAKVEPTIMIDADPAVNKATLIAALRTVLTQTGGAQ